MMPTTLPVLYILMRNDLASLNSGKAMAQASHASDAFNKAVEAKMSEVSKEGTSKKFYEKLNASYNEWKNSTPQGFGTVLVLEADMKTIYTKISLMKSMYYIADVIHDPTYPILDGSVVHHIPLDTCAFVFVEDKFADATAASVLGTMELHR